MGSELRTSELIANEKMDFSDEIFAINAFKALFIDEKDLNVEDFDQKKSFILLSRITNNDCFDKTKKKKLFDIKNL